MSDFMQKLLGGQNPSAEDWKKHLLNAHAGAPSMSPQAFADCRNIAGLNSYEWLASVAVNSNQKMVVVDLACGDGFLIPVLQKSLPETTQYFGIDMSEEELKAARKRELKSTTFCCSTADAIALENESVDFVFCHMAFMLMLPIEPVVSEVKRILKPGGVFAGVIGGKRNESGLLFKIQNCVGEFLHERYPNMSVPVTGDERVQSEDGLKEVLEGFNKVEIQNDTFKEELDSSGVWEHLKNMYLIGGLCEADRKALRQKLNNLFDLELKNSPKLVLDFSMRLFCATK